jgi:hypothetical protein
LGENDKRNEKFGTGLDENINDERVSYEEVSQQL